jgi:hypothetical protein
MTEAGRQEDDLLIGETGDFGVRAAGPFDIRDVAAQVVLTKRSGEEAVLRPPFWLFPSAKVKARPLSTATVDLTVRRLNFRSRSVHPVHDDVA